MVEETPEKPPRIQETQTNQLNRHYYPKLLFYSYHNNLWRSLDLSLMNCEEELDSLWTRDCVLIETHFMITSNTLYISVVTLSISDNIKFLENLNQGFQRTKFCNKHRSEITTKPKNNNLDYMIHPKFRNVNRLFVLSFKNSDNDSTTDSFDKYYLPFV